MAYLTDAKRKLRQVVWVNLREEAVLECDGHTHSLRQPGPPMTADQLEVRPFCLLHNLPIWEAFWLGRVFKRSCIPMVQMEKLKPQGEQTQGVTDCSHLSDSGSGCDP